MITVEIRAKFDYNWFPLDTGNSKYGQTLKPLDNFIAMVNTYIIGMND